MNTEILVAVLATIGTVVGSLLGAVGTARMTSYRLQQLEKRVEKHNEVIERTYKLEARVDVLEEKT